MFDLCKNSAFPRTDKKSVKILSIKVTDSEEKALDEMKVYYGEKYTSNLIRMGLKLIYDDMKKNEKK